MDAIEESKLNKPNQALVVKPEKGKLSANGSKLHLALLYKSQESIRALKPGQSLTLNHMFEAAIGDLADMVNESTDDLSNTKRLFKKYLIEMMSTVVRWEAPDAKSDVVWSGMPMLSFSELEIRDGRLWARWQLPGPLLEALADPTLYTPILLSSVAKLDTYSSIALFQICTRYRNNPTGKTSKNPPEWWMDALIGTPGVDPKTKKRKPREWRKVKSELINEAIAEVNRKTDIEIELIEYREGLPGAGRNVTSVQFAVRRKASINVAPPKIDLELATLQNKLGVSDSLIASHSKQFTEEQIKIALYKLEARSLRTDLPAIANPNTYISKILREEFENPFTESDARVQRLPTSKGGDTSDPKHEKHRNKTTEAVAPVLESVAQRVREELTSLTPQEQRLYAEAAFADFQVKGMATSSMNRSLQSNSFSGVLLSKMIDIYATEKYGKDWASLAIPTKLTSIEGDQ